MELNELPEGVWGHTLGFLHLHVQLPLTITLLVYQSLTTTTLESISGPLLMVLLKGDPMVVTVLIVVMQDILLLFLLSITTTVKQLQ